MSDQAPELIEDLKWAAPPPPPAPMQIPWLWIGLGVLLLVLVVGWIWNRKRLGKRLLPFIHDELPHVKAARALQELKPLLREGHETEFTVAVSQVIRVYIQERFGLRAPHRSTEEFLAEASQSKLLSDSNQQLLTGFLAQCDLVKFARQNVVVDEMTQLLGTANQFVTETVPPKQTAKVAA